MQRESAQREWYASSTSRVGISATDPPNVNCFGRELTTVALLRWGLRKNSVVTECPRGSKETLQQSKGKQKNERDEMRKREGSLEELSTRITQSSRKTMEIPEIYGGSGQRG